MLRITPLLLLPLLFVLAACERDTATDLGPPEGWHAEGTERWWRDGVDMDYAFRNLADFEDFEVGERGDGLRPESAVVRNVQRRFLPLYRNNPEVVDSVFGAIAVPIIEREAEPGQEGEERDRLVSQINRRLQRVFYPAQPRPREAQPIVVPDSLQQIGVAGTIRLQIYLNEDGEPLAIEKIEGVHPTQDAIVMRNYAERRWQPAHLDGSPIESWIRSEVSIGG